MERLVDWLTELLGFNPNHAADGKFSSGAGGVSTADARAELERQAENGEISPRQLKAKLAELDGAPSKVLSRSDMRVTGKTAGGLDIIHPDDIHAAIRDYKDTGDRLDLDNIDFRASKVDPDFFRDPSMSGVLHERLSLRGSNLTGMNLSGAHFDDCDLTGANLTTARVHGAKFTNSALDDAEMVGMAGKDVSFEDSTMSGVQLQSAVLPGAQFHRIWGQGMDASHASITGGEFWGGTFSESNFQAANLTGNLYSKTSFPDANFLGANMQSSRMRAADFEGANVAGANLSKSISDPETSFTGVEWKHKNGKFMEQESMDSWMAHGSQPPVSDGGGGEVTQSGPGPRPGRGWFLDHPGKDMANLLGGKEAEKYTGDSQAGRYNETDQRAVHRYTALSSDINYTLRHPGQRLPDGIRDSLNTSGKDRGVSTKDAIDGLDAAMAKSVTNRDMVVKRSSGLWDDSDGYDGIGTVAAKALGRAMRPEDLVGTRISDKGYTSTSFGDGFVSAEKGRVNIEILVPAGTRGLYVNATGRPKSGSEFPHEREFMLDRGTTLEFTGYQYSARTQSHWYTATVVDQRRDLQASGFSDTMRSYGKANETTGTGIGRVTVHGPANSVHDHRQGRQTGRSGHGTFTETLIAHLPGQHDQASHGGGGHAEDGHTHMLAGDELTAALRKSFETTFTVDGQKFRTIVDDVHRGRTDRSAPAPDPNGRQKVYGQIQAEVNGVFERVGRFDRIFNPADDSVSHELLTVDDRWQGKGVGSGFLAATMPEYSKIGAKTISVDAGLEVGGYAWAKAGYGWAEPRSGQEGLAGRTKIVDQLGRERARTHFGKSDEQLYESGEADADFSAWMSFKQKVDSAVRYAPTLTPKEIADWKSPNGFFTGKDVLMGSTWYGSKPVTEGMTSSSETVEFFDQGDDTRVVGGNAGLFKFSDFVSDLLGSVHNQAIIAHLPGQHDQASHGGGGHDTHVRDKTFIRNILSFDVNVPGVGKVEVRTDGIEPIGESRAVWGTLSVNGEQVGSFARHFYDQHDYVEHGLLDIEPAWQGKGIASAMGAEAERRYVDAGYKEIHLLATLQMGGYAWAKADYQFVGTTGRDLQFREAEYKASERRSAAVGAATSSADKDRVRKLSDDDTAEYSAFKDRIDSEDGTVTPKQIADWKSTNGFYTGKDIMVGSTWKGVKRLPLKSAPVPEGPGGQQALFASLLASMLEQLQAHLPGQHDQQSHGGGDGADHGHVGHGLSPDEARKAGEKFFAEGERHDFTEDDLRFAEEDDLKRPVFLVKNGPLAIWFDREDPDMELVGYVSTLKPIIDSVGESVAVHMWDKSPVPGSQADAGGWVWSGESTVHLNVGKLRESHEKALAGERDSEWHSPVRQGMHAVQYVATHELGHVYDWSSSDDDNAMSSLKPTSKYAAYNAREKYAEAFVEWYGTKGGTTNETAKAYAGYYEWDLPS